VPRTRRTATEDRCGDPWIGRGQRDPDRGAQRNAAAVADRCSGADLGQFLEGVEGRLPFRHGALRQRDGVVDADRLEPLLLACRHSLPEVGAELLVLRGARSVAVPGRVDGDDGETPRGHVAETIRSDGAMVAAKLLLEEATA
jgi:hypothetical protein